MRQSLRIRAWRGCGARHRSELGGLGRCRACFSSASAFYRTTDLRATSRFSLACLNAPHAPARERSSRLESIQAPVP
jgi:hypothetical protein